MKNLKQILLSILILFSINGFAQSSKIAAPTKASVNDSILAVSSTQTARHIPFSELRDRVLTDITNITLDTITFNDGGFIEWNGGEYTIDVETGLGATIQVGQETLMLYFNDTGITIPNGTVLHPKAGTSIMGVIVPTPELADASLHEQSEGTLSIATHDILNGELGFSTRFGKVRGLDTSLLIPGSTIWLSATTPGTFTNSKPEFPNYSISLGGVLNSATAPDGEIFCTITRTIEDVFNNFWNGIFLETFKFNITSDGAIITGSLLPSNGHPDMTMNFSDGLTTLDTSPAVTITLTAGTDTNPQSNYIYIPKSTKVLTVNTSGFPTEEHIKVSTTVLQTSATTQTDGALRNQNHNDHLASTIDFQGHLTHMTERMRQDPSKWDSGVEPTVTIIDASTPDDVFVATTGGQIYQIHKHSFPALDMETGEEVHVVNHFTTPYIGVSNLNTQILDATGTTLNNQSFSFVLWGVVNSLGETSHLMINLPTDSYAFASPQNAVDDAFNYSVYTIPKAFEGVGFLISRLTFTYKNDDWVLFDTTDLRGTTPNTTAGGGIGGAGVTEFTTLTDTPNSYIGEGLKMVRVGGGETALEFSDDYVTNTTTQTITGTKTFTDLVTYSGDNNGGFLAHDPTFNETRVAPTGIRAESLQSSLAGWYSINNIKWWDVAGTSTVTLTPQFYSAAGVINLPSADGTLALTSDIPTKGYEVYTALITQTGTNDPIVVVLENELSGAIVWTRSGIGDYIGTLTSAFTSDKTTLLMTVNSTGGATYPIQIIAGRLNNNSVYIKTVSTNSTGTLLDGQLSKTTIDIKVYD